MYLIIAGVILLVILIIGVARASTPEGKAKAASYCTKHQIAKPVPGGPERLVWVYGPHRTAGNKCDGSQHKHAALGGWW